jgi:hypothetical protein
LPKGTITFALVGGLGQLAYNLLDQRHTNALEQPTRPPMLQRVAAAKWSPIRSLSNEQYTEMLREKVTAIEAEIALVDEDIEQLKTTLSDQTGIDTKAGEKEI